MAMNRSIALLLVFFLSGFAGSIKIDPIDVGSNSSGSDYFQYDDGSAQWYTWEGSYRGVWFNSGDFWTIPFPVTITYSEFWMYHHSSYPWDISEFYAEIWNGSSSGPSSFLNRMELVALHYAPVFAYYPPFFNTEPNFWVLENTEMSAGSWPSILSDGTTPAVHHSFYSDDFSLWEPWSAGVNTGDYFVRIECDDLQDLASTSWGSIKSLF